MINTKQRVSVVFPLYNEKQNLEPLYRQVKEACSTAGINYEMVFVDDGSTDDSLDIIKKLRTNDPGVVYISLSRNFGHQNAIFAGMAYSGGDATITMDADLQHPPSLIPQMIEMWRNGAEIVYTTKKDAHLGCIDYCFFKAFYWIISKMSGLEFDFGQSDFRLLDKKVVKIILQIPEYHKFLRGQVKWIGFKQTAISYDADKRYAGLSKFSYRKRLSFALDGIFAFSSYPLRIITELGLVTSFCSFLFILFISFVWIFKKMGFLKDLILLPGWATLVIAVFFLGSLQMMAIGILGEYIGRIYDQSKGRPNFIIRERSGQEGNEWK